MPSLKGPLIQVNTVPDTGAAMASIIVIVDNTAAPALYVVG